MSMTDDAQIDSKLLQYLLGNLPAEESEQLDELSITDDKFVTFLNAAENDLVDAYVRDELRGETLQRFESYYLSTARRQQKVHTAQLLYLAEIRKKATRRTLGTS